MQNLFLALMISFSTISCQKENEKDDLALQVNAIDVKVTGNGSPLILLPGFACSGEEWNETIDKLKDNFECHVVTYAGFGNVAPVDTPWMKQVEMSIINYIKNKHLNKPVVIGHSIGGTFGISLCSKYHDIFSKLIVVDELPCIGMVMYPNFSPEMVNFDNPYNNQMLNMDSEAFTGMVSQMVANMCQNKNKQKQITGWMSKADRKTYIHGYTELLKTDLRNNLSAIHTPTLVLAATMYPSKEQIEKNYTEQYEKLPNKTIKLVDNAAHFIMFDQPEIFISEVTRFIKNK